MFQINVQDVRPGTQKHVLASCEITLTSEDGLETITIVDVRVLQNRAGDKWIGYPSQPVKDWETGIKYVPDMRFSRELKQRIAEMVLAEFERDDVRYVVAAEQGCPALRPAVKPIREALIGSGARSYPITWAGTVELRAARDRQRQATENI